MKDLHLLLQVATQSMAVDVELADRAHSATVGPTIPLSDSGVWFSSNLNIYSSYASFLQEVRG